MLQCTAVRSCHHDSPARYGASKVPVHLLYFGYRSFLFRSNFSCREHRRADDHRHAKDTKTRIWGGVFFEPSICTVPYPTVPNIHVLVPAQVSLYIRVSRTTVPQPPVYLLQYPPTYLPRMVSRLYSRQVPTLRYRACLFETCQTYPTVPCFINPLTAPQRAPNRTSGFECVNLDIHLSAALRDHHPARSLSLCIPCYVFSPFVCQLLPVLVLPGAGGRKLKLIDSATRRLLYFLLAILIADRSSILFAFPAAILLVSGCLRPPLRAIVRPRHALRVLTILCIACYCCVDALLNRTLSRTARRESIEREAERGRRCAGLCTPFHLLDYLPIYLHLHTHTHPHTHTHTNIHTRLGRYIILVLPERRQIWPRGLVGPQTWRP